MTGRTQVKAFKALLIGLTLLCPATGMAQDFPTKPIKLIVPFPPGGPHDIIARVVGQRMSEIVKQPIVIENRSGQGGVTGTDAVAKSPPDGYTIAIASAGALAISPSMEKVSYETLKDLQPITLVATVPEMLVVATSVPANNMKELVALANSQPGKLNFASSGPGSLPHRPGHFVKRPDARARIVQAHPKDQHRACALPRGGPPCERFAGSAGADGLPRPAGAAAADQGWPAHADCHPRRAPGAQ